ncbi:sugar ABC transporter permease [Blautia schinkii]|nr:sugar ABC transporter permease [Blautia schinkii]
MQKKKRKLRAINICPYLFVLPFLVIYLTFNFYPLVYSFFISLTSWDGFGESVFIGFKNYVDIFTKDPYFIKSIKNTLIFMAFNLPINIIGGLLLASALNSRLLKRNGFFRTATFLPYLTIPVAIGVLFSLLFDWNSGLVNKILSAVGLIDQNINFLGVPFLARMVVVIMICWKYIGYHMIFFNAGIIGIPTELYEAAEVDGATAVQKFFKITVPMLRPIIEFLLIMNIIWGFQLFDEPNILFSPWISSSGAAGVVGGPRRCAMTAVWNLYDTTFGTQMQYGKGAAISYGLFMFIFLFSGVGLLLVKLLNRNKSGGDSHEI